MSELQLGLHLLTYGASWPEVVRTVELADELGYDLLLGADHLFATGGDPYEPFFEAWTSLAVWAQMTRRARLGHLVGANALRNPGLVAKMAATVDHVSGGRLVLGLGAGWYDEELRRHGMAVGRGVAERLDWLDEALAIIRRLLAGETVTHDGPAYHFDRVRQAPRPLQSAVPILVGGAGPRKTLPIVARHADMWHLWVGPEDVDAFTQATEIVEGYCREAGREPSAVARLPGAKVVIRDDPSEAVRFFELLVARHAWPAEVWQYAWLGPPAWVAERLAAYRRAGANGFIAQVISPFDQQTMERLVGEVRPALASRTEAMH